MPLRTSSFWRHHPSLQTSYNNVFSSHCSTATIMHVLDEKLSELCSTAKIILQKLCSIIRNNKQSNIRNNKHLIYNVHNKKNAAITVRTRTYREIHLPDSAVTSLLLSGMKGEPFFELFLSRTGSAFSFCERERVRTRGHRGLKRAPFSKQSKTKQTTTKRRHAQASSSLAQNCPR